jgi:molybdopterin converting factor small subunit
MPLRADLIVFPFVVNTEMAVKVLIPTPLQKFTDNQASLSCEGGNIVELLDVLESSFPGIKARLCDDQGELRRFVNFYVNSEDIRFLDGKDTPLKDGDEVSIVPAVAGG